MTLLRLYGFTFVADAMESLELRLWIFSSPPRVERLEYRWYADMGFSRCGFEIRDSPSGIEIVVPAESVLPFQSVPAQSQIEFRITISKLNSNSIDFSVYENVLWYPDHVELFLLQDVPIAPDESWEVAADLLDEHGYAERAKSLRQFVARNRSGRSV